MNTPTDALHDAWLALLAQLLLTAAACAGPEALRRFRTLGSRRCAAAQRQLLQQHAHLLAVARAWGLELDDDVTQRAALARGPAHDVVQAFAATAVALDDAAALALRRGNLRLARWMHERSRMHRLHAQSLTAGAWSRDVDAGGSRQPR